MATRQEIETALYDFHVAVHAHTKTMYAAWALAEVDPQDPRVIAAQSALDAAQATRDTCRTAWAQAMNLGENEAEMEYAVILATRNKLAEERGR